MNDLPNIGSEIPGCVRMLSFLKRAVTNKQTPEAMSAAASLVQRELGAHKVLTCTLQNLLLHGAEKLSQSIF